MKTTKNPAGAGTPNDGANQKWLEHSQITIKLSPRQRLALLILYGNPDGVLSNKLRAVLMTNNVAQFIRNLRLKGFEIATYCDKYRADNGDLLNIGRYVLRSRQRAVELLGRS